jgi:hypothetical protein
MKAGAFSGDGLLRPDSVSPPVRTKKNTPSFFGFIRCLMSRDWKRSETNLPIVKQKRLIFEI